MPYPEDAFLSGMNDLAGVSPEPAAAPSFADQFQEMVMSRLKKTRKDYEDEYAQDFWSRFGVAPGSKATFKQKLAGGLSEAARGMQNAYQRDILKHKDVPLVQTQRELASAAADKRYDAEQTRARAEAGSIFSYQRAKEAAEAQLKKAGIETKSRERIATEKAGIEAKKADNQALLFGARSEQYRATAEYQKARAKMLSEYGDLKDASSQMRFLMDKIKEGNTAEESQKLLSEVFTNVAKKSTAEGFGKLLIKEAGAGPGSQTTRVTSSQVPQTDDLGYTSMVQGPINTSVSQRGGGAAPGGPKASDKALDFIGFTNKSDNAVLKYTDPKVNPGLYQGSLDAKKQPPVIKSLPGVNPSAQEVYGIAEQAYKKAGRQIIPGMPRNQAATDTINARKKLHQLNVQLSASVIRAWNSGTLEDFTGFAGTETGQAVRRFMSNRPPEEILAVSKSLEKIQEDIKTMSGKAFSAAEIKMELSRLPTVASKAENFLQHTIVSHLTLATEQLLAELRMDPATKDQVLQASIDRIIDKTTALMDKARIGRSGMGGKLELKDIDARSLFADILEEAGYKTPAQKVTAAPAKKRSFTELLDEADKQIQTSRKGK